MSELTVQNERAGIARLAKHGDQAMIAMLILHAVLDAINEAGEQGAPEGVIYTALSQFGATLDQHQRLVQFLTDQGYVTRKFNNLWIAEPGRKMLAKLAPLSQ